jgi:hypothetical protein
LNEKKWNPQMNNDLNAAGASEVKSPWLGIIRILFLAVLIAVLYLLAEDMVGHRFFRGGWINHQGSLEP